jgi:DNA-binding transcriptional regulator YiaG
MKNSWKEDLKGLVGLSYIVFKNVPMKKSEHGPIIDLEPGTLEKLAAKAIVKERIGFHGKEVKFLRKALGLSLEKFAGKLGITSGAVFKWEQKPEERLHPMNEVAVRSFVAEQLGIELSGQFSQLLGRDTEPKELILKAS